jgi:uncharacterized membrane protein YkoI
MEATTMKHNRRRLFGAVVVAMGLFVVAGSGLALAQGSGPSILQGGEDDSITQDNVTLSEGEAIDIATAETNGTVEEVELEREDGTPVYEVELVTAGGAATEVAVHADDGTLLSSESEDEENETEEHDEMEEENETEEHDEMEEENETEEHDEMEEENETEEHDEMEEDDETVAPGNVSLSEEDAVGIATAEANGTVEEVELEREDGTPVYEVELATADAAETEITVHADDGTVLDVETEDE